MKIFKFYQVAVFLLISTVTISCFREEDPGPLQSDTRDFSITNFDKIDAGEDFVVTVLQNPVYSIHAEGDRRNLDDLAVTKSGSTLLIHFANKKEHSHTTYITIGTPVLTGLNFYGANKSMISGFKDTGSISVLLSGASVSQLNIESDKIIINLSGASKLLISGKAGQMQAVVSGASELNSYPMIANSADIDASGAGIVNVYAVSLLKAMAGGASTIYYRGDAVVNAVTSGAGVVKKDD